MTSVLPLPARPHARLRRGGAARALPRPRRRPARLCAVVHRRPRGRRGRRPGDLPARLAAPAPAAGRRPTAAALAAAGAAARPDRRRPRTARAHRESPARRSCPSSTRSTAATSACSTAGCSTSCCATCRRPIARCSWRPTTATRQPSGSPPGLASPRAPSVPGSTTPCAPCATGSTSLPRHRPRRPPPAPRAPPGDLLVRPATAAPQWRMPTGEAYRRLGGRVPGQRRPDLPVDVRQGRQPARCGGPHRGGVPGGAAAAADLGQRRRGPGLPARRPRARCWPALAAHTRGWR